MACAICMVILITEQPRSQIPKQTFANTVFVNFQEFSLEMF